jgi:hypothetical protein
MSIVIIHRIILDCIGTRHSIVGRQCSTYFTRYDGVRRFVAANVVVPYLIKPMNRSVIEEWRGGLDGVRYAVGGDGGPKVRMNGMCYQPPLLLLFGDCSFNFLLFNSCNE